MNNPNKSERIGEISYTKHGTKAVIVNYINNKRVLVEFCDEYKYQYWTTYINFINGRLTNPYEPRSSRGLYGYIGVGKYNSKKDYIAYGKWKGILQRCFNSQKYYSTLSYNECVVSKEWLNFQNFAEWYYQNVYLCDESLCVDKDILYHNNKEYSAEKCLLVPLKINLIFVKEKSDRGNLPIGVQKCHIKNKFISTLSIDSCTKYLGIFDTPEDAFQAYKTSKEAYIKQLADTYKEIIPDYLYDILYHYEVQKDD